MPLFGRGLKPTVNNKEGIIIAALVPCDSLFKSVRWLEGADKGKVNKDGAVKDLEDADEDSKETAGDDIYAVMRMHSPL